jgi:uncharacterized membrane protein (UPF0127 family)
VAEANNPAAPQGINNAATSNEALAQRREATEAEALKAVGRACQVDTECPLYLRCAAQTCQVPPAVDGQGATDSTPVAVLLGAQGEGQFYLELAISSEEQQRGLMHRPRMSDQWGMLFIYDRQRQLSFWMENTLIPLDMVFINDAGLVVGVVPMAEPLTRTSRRVEGESRYVLELNGGLAARFGIQAGTRVRFAHLEERYMPRSAP